MTGFGSLSGIWFRAKYLHIVARRSPRLQYQGAFLIIAGEESEDEISIPKKLEESVLQGRLYIRVQGFGLGLQGLV